MSLGVRLKQLRMKAGESLQEAADSVGVSKTHFWELERETSSNPSVELLESIADHYGVTIRFLVGEDLESGDTADENVMRMFRQVGKLSESDKQLLDEMIRAMLKRSKGGDHKD